MSIRENAWKKLFYVFVRGTMTDCHWPMHPWVPSVGRCKIVHCFFWLERGVWTFKTVCLAFCSTSRSSEQDFTLDILTNDVGTRKICFALVDTPHYPHSSVICTSSGNHSVHSVADAWTALNKSLALLYSAPRFPLSLSPGSSEFLLFHLPPSPRLFHCTTQYFSCEMSEAP